MKLGVEHSEVRWLDLKSDVFEPQSRDFARPQARGRQQADDGGVRVRPQGIDGTQLSSGIDQSSNFLVGVDVGGGPAIVRDKACRWDFCLRHRRADVSQESADNTESPG